MSIQLTLLGTATSQGVPVIGCTCAACRSGDPRDNRLRTAALLEVDGRRLAVDAGPDFRQQYLRLGVDELDGVLLTHEHSDHTAGLDDLRPLIFRMGRAMPIYCLPRVARDVRERFAYAFGDYPGVPRFMLEERMFGARIRVGNSELMLLEVRHAQLRIFGFRIGDLAYLTDVKELPEATLAQLTGLDTLVISCLNYTGTHSHLSLDEALSYAAHLRPRRTVLTHLSHRLGPHAYLQSELPRGVEVGYDGLRITTKGPKD